MCAKGVIFGGIGRENGGQKGVFRASETGKRALFCVPEGWMPGTEGFSDQNRTLCHIIPRSGITPLGPRRRVRQMREAGSHGQCSSDRGLSPDD